MTRAYLHSLIWWQEAMMASIPEGLTTWIDLDAAATEHPAALEWIAFLEGVARGHEEILEEAKARGVDPESPAYGSKRTVLTFVRYAIDCAREHAGSLGEP